jgi:hypothetical protein
MLNFSAADPYPLLDPAQYSTQELQRHSEGVDRWLGFEISGIEERLSRQGCLERPGQRSGTAQQLWFGLATQMLLTPYVELRSLLEKLGPKAGEKIIDLGAAYGRMGFVIHRHYPDLLFVGYEFVGERVRETKRVLQRVENSHCDRKQAGLPKTQIRLEHADLSLKNFRPEHAQIYFIYDYGHIAAIEKTLYDLRRIAERMSIRVVARGRNCRALIDRHHSSWLLNAFPGEAEGRVSIYKTSHQR